MKFLKQQVAFAALVTTALSAGSAQAMEGSVGMHFADFDDFENGFGIYGHVDVLPEVRLRGEFTSVDHLDLLGWSGAYVLEMEPLEMEFGGFYEFWDLEGPPEDDVYGVYGRVNYSVLDELNMFGQLRFMTFDNFDDEDLSIGFGANYAINEQFAVDFSADFYTNADMVDQTFIRLGGSFHF